MNNIKTKSRFCSNKGFTLIEIISVLVILAILAAVIVSRIMNTSSESIAAQDVIKSHIKYAQIMAMKSNNVCGILFNKNTYSIFKNNSTKERITLPGNDGTDFTIPQSLGIANETIYFDLWGTPYSNKLLTKIRPTGELGNLGIIITKDTGYIQ
jgi:prepilin-type N-terminal cleavage/methylation domain-containing protein